MTEQQQAYWIEQFNAYEESYQKEQSNKRRLMLREVLGRDLYPTAWGVQWDSNTWKGMDRTLNFWLDIAYRNIEQHVKQF